MEVKSLYELNEEYKTFAPEFEDIQENHDLLLDREHDKIEKQMQQRARVLVNSTGS